MSDELTKAQEIIDLIIKIDASEQYKTDLDNWTPVATDFSFPNSVGAAISGIAIDGIENSSELDSSAVGEIQTDHSTSVQSTIDTMVSSLKTKVGELDTLVNARWP